ncbi:GGDEF domain-containing protein [Actinophytocola oryzae]|uniref:GGDEF domain-containing protein n=1 Tax=Actinophytocola oryzae TaxID=502181 RepID=UPI001FBB988F|nr:GGDEF domain-containing protein [Actinophytocola oryzae]
MVVFVLIVEAVTLVTAASTVTVVPVTRTHWLWFVLLVVASVACLEAAKGMERMREDTVEGTPYVNLLSVWMFAGVLLLPPPLLCALVTLGYLHSWVRVYRFEAPAHRKVFTAASVMLGCLAAYWVLHSVYSGVAETFAAALDGPAGLLAVVAAAVVYRAVNYGLVVAVILATNLDRPVRTALGPATDQLMLAGAVGLGCGVAVVMTARPWWTPLLIVTVLALHTGLLMPQFRDASRNDAKTGLLDAMFWAKLVTDELARARRMDCTVGVLLLDLDHFKRVNDGYGHLAGDMVLRAVADAIKRTVRGRDRVGRYGGEEFAIVLPGLGVDDVRQAAERVRATVAELSVTVFDFDGEEKDVTGLTASVGAAVYPVHGGDRTSLLLAADAALYGAKTAGRDCTRVSGEHSGKMPATRRPPGIQLVPRQADGGR